MINNFNPKEIKSLAKNRLYEEALDRCNMALARDPDDVSEILRARAYVYAHSGQYQDALVDWKTIFDMGNSGAPDYYLAADNALYIGLYDDTVGWLNRVIDLGRQQGDDWFTSAAYFLLAYAKMEQKRYSEAFENLDLAVSAEPDCAMYLPHVGMCDSLQLRNEIRKRSSS